MEECVSQPDEQFRKSEIVGWFRRHYPDVKESTLTAHVQAATANAPNRAQNHPYHGSRAALLRRIGHGVLGPARELRIGRRLGLVPEAAELVRLPHRALMSGPSPWTG